MMSILKSVHFFNAFNVFKKAPIQKILKENLACDVTKLPKKTSSIHRKCSLQKKLLHISNIEIVVLRENETEICIVKIL